MPKLFFKRLFIFILLVAATYFIYYLLAQGMPSVPDASKYRKLLYAYTFFCAPFIIMAGVFYLFACLLHRLIPTLLISLLLGLLGPWWLYHEIITSRDPEAAMGYLAICYVYTFMSSVIFMILTLIQLLVRKFLKK